MSEVLRAEGLTRILPGAVPVTLVRDISLSIDHGEFVMIMGPSGSGKSSLLYLLGLLDAPTAGKVWLDGRDTSAFGEDELAELRLASLGFVFQFHFLLAEFSVLDNVLLPMHRLGSLPEEGRHARARQLLADLGLADQIHRRPDQLSGGQRQRVAIARAMANDPLVIMADEPTGNLDTASSRNVRDILSDFARNRGKTVLAVTHDPDFAQAGDRLIRLVDGRIASDGDTGTPDAAGMQLPTPPP
ncbi:MAG: ABC transporter ATP-binding protein [Alphaproteobacteria bacterium]|nr:ABC transporter ATP-binding protein [Alphaproteobacteria bacterium]